MNAKALPAYLIAKLNVKDPDDYMNRYGMPVLAQLETAGAEVLSVSPDPAVVEGEWNSNWTVLIRFPDMESAKKFYHSADYAPLLSLRTNELTHDGTVLFLEGFDPAALGL